MNTVRKDRKPGMPEKIAELLTSLSGLKTVLWDEAGTTKQAWSIRKQSGASKQKRSGHLDEVAAALLLQSFLDSTSDKGGFDA
jgi:putative Holliday junction resolvase